MIIYFLPDCLTAPSPSPVMSVGKLGFLTWPVLLTPRVQAGAAAGGAGGAPRVPPPQDRQPRPRHPQVSASCSGAAGGTVKSPGQPINYLVVRTDVPTTTVGTISTATSHPSHSATSQALDSFPCPAPAPVSPHNGNVRM